MTPDPYVRRQAWLMAFALVVAGAAGLTAVAAAGTAITLLLWVWLRHMYISDRRRSGYNPSALPAFARRELLDRGMDRWIARTGLVAAFALAVGILVQPLDAARIEVWILAAGVVLGIGGVLWSSFVDWYWVLPRVSGLLGHRPCRREPEEGARRVSWEEVTRWWLLHRIASVVFVSLGVALVLGAGLSLGLSGIDVDESARTVSAVVAGGLVTIGLVFQRKAAEAGPHVTRPNTRVGSFYADPDEGAGWVVDVAVEGAQLVLRRQHRGRKSDAEEAGASPSFFEAKGDTSVPLTQRLKGAERFESCATCSGLNWYCIQNPSAWDKG